jgi:hypothetical protein
MVFGVTDVFGEEKEGAEKKKTPAISEATLQSHVMSFADRFTAILSTAFWEYEDREPSKEDRQNVLGLVTYSLSNAYIIAGESDPEVALLDMLSMIILGRFFFEEVGLQMFGEAIEPIQLGFYRAEKDIRKIASNVLTNQQLDGLMALIEQWRVKNSKKTFFPFIRFSNFAADRRESKLTRSDAPDGMFESVEAATEQVEEMRLLAERAMYLGTRMPQLSGLFADLWMSRLTSNPDVQRLLTDISQFSKTSAHLSAIAEKIPDQIAVERKASIQQLLDGLSAQRKAVIQELLGEEQRVRGLLSDLKQTIESGNQLIASMNSFVTKFESAFVSENTRPFDIREYQKAFVEVSNSANALLKLAAAADQINTQGDRNKLISQLVQAIDRVEGESKGLINYTMKQLMILIAVWLVGFIIAKLLIRYFSNRMDSPGKGV